MLRFYRYKYRALSKVSLLGLEVLSGISLSEYGFGGVPSTVEEVVRVRFCCLLIVERPTWETRAKQYSDTGLVKPPPLSGPVLRDTARLSQRYPPIARYGFFGVSTWPIGCDTPSPFSEHFPLGEHSK